MDYEFDKIQQLRKIIDDKDAELVRLRAQCIEQEEREGVWHKLLLDCNTAFTVANQGVQRLGYLSADTWTIIDVVHAAVKKELKAYGTE